MANSSPNKQIAKNTIFLYVRMVVTMIISLYTSRILLQTFGVDDFGLYGIIGGIVTMFASLKTMFTVATQRYLNIEIGRDNEIELNKVFNVSILVNLVVAVVFFAVVEVGGLWLIEYKLHIAPERMTAAIWVFQLSVATAVVQIMNIPFDANIIAREKMDVFAIVSIFDAFAKLVIVILLPFFDWDKLILYGLMMLGVVLCNLAINAIFCWMHFKESRLKSFRISDVRTKFADMFAFSGWAFFGNIIFALVNEGLNILLNIFGGVVANASRTIAYQVRGALNNVVSNVYVAIKPQAIQSYARQDMERFYKLMFTGAKVVGYFYLLMVIPLYFTIDKVLMLWLGTIPLYAVSFLKASFLYQFVRVLHESIGTFFVTIGRLKEYQITEFIALGSALPLSYIGLRFCGMPLYGLFLVMAFSELLNLVSILFIARRIGNFDIGRFFSDVLLPYCLMAILCVLSEFVIKNYLASVVANDVMKMLSTIIVGIIVQLICLYFVGLTKDEKRLLTNMIKSKGKNA